MKRQVLISFSLLCFVNLLCAQSNNINVLWSKVYGGGGMENDYSVAAMLDGGFICASTTSVTSVTKPINKCSPHVGSCASDIWITKHNRDGNIEWQRAYGSSGNDYASKIIQTKDGGFAFIGTTENTDGDVVPNTGYLGNAAWVVKLSNQGEIEWQNRIIDFYAQGKGFSIVESPDSGYFVGGSTVSRDSAIKGLILSNNSSINVVAVKLNQNGAIVWKKTYGGSNQDQINSLSPNLDGGFVFCGYTYSSDGNLDNTRDTSQKYNNFAWIMKCDSKGQTVWQKVFSDKLGSSLNSILATSEGGFLYVGSVIFPNITGYSDGLAVKLNAKGEILWKKTFGGSLTDNLNSAVEVNNDYILAGYSNSVDEDLTGLREPYSYINQYDPWVIRVNKNGGSASHNVIRDSLFEQIYSIVRTSDSKVVTVGSSNKGLWAAKFEFLNTAINEPSTFKSLDVFPNPANNNINIKLQLFESKSVKVGLYNTLGQLVKVVKLASYTENLEENVDVSSLSEGVYFLTVNVDGYNFVRKVCLNH